MYIVLFAIAVIVVLWSYGKLQKKKKAANVNGWVKSQDLDGKSNKVYRNYKAGISAKPDIVEGDKVIEYKSGFANLKLTSKRG